MPKINLHKLTRQAYVLMPRQMHKLTYQAYVLMPRQMHKLTHQAYVLMPRQMRKLTHQACSLMPRQMRKLTHQACSLMLCLMTPYLAAADDDNKTQNNKKRLDEYVVTDKAKTLDPTLESLSPETLDIHKYTDISRLLKAIPGISSQEEDGFGLLPNISIRGNAPERSARIILKEDNVLIAPAPIAAPEAYYFPHMARIHALELDKIKGEINLISTPIPKKHQFIIKTRAGQYNSGMAMIKAGGYNNDNYIALGGMLEALYQRSDGFKQLDNSANTGFLIKDYSAKLIASAPNSAWQAELKAQASSQLAHETYLGLTASDFAANPYRRYAASAMDRFSSDHTEISGRLSARHGPWRFEMLGYRTSFSRDWFKLDKLNTDGTDSLVAISSILADPARHSRAYSIISGQADSSGGALLIKHNNRSYHAYGTKIALSSDLDTGPIQHEARLGFGFHADLVDRFQWYERYDMRDGNMLSHSSDAPGSESNRIGSARQWSLDLSDRLMLGALTLTPELELALLDTGEQRYATTDPQRQEPALRTSDNRLYLINGGLRASYRVGSRAALFAGIYSQTFPSVSGSSKKSSETVTSYELGAQLDMDWLQFGLSGFVNDHRHLRGICTAASGGDCSIGEQFDGGTALAGGLEAELGGTQNLSVADLTVFWHLSYTYVSARFSSSFSSDFAPWGEVNAGDSLPYIPEHQFNMDFGVGYHERARLDARISWVGAARAKAGSGTIPNDELVDSRLVVDLTGRYVLYPNNVSLYFQVRNLLDMAYIAARRPAGLRPGLPRQVLAGLEIAF